MTDASAATCRIEAALAAVVERSPDITAILSRRGTIDYCSSAMAVMLGRSPEFLTGCSFASLVHLEDQTTWAWCLGRSIEVAETASAEVRLSHVNGSWVDVEARAMNLDDEPDVRSIVVVVRDARQRRSEEEELRRLALQDPLTRLANRALFREHVERALAHQRRTPVCHAVLFLDLDRFKNVNDSLGHAAGDDLLTIVAERITSRLRPGDVAARLGGDEFAILLENTSTNDAVAVAERVIDVLTLPFTVQGREVISTASVGIAFSENVESAEAFLRNADVAMYRAKAAGRGRHEVFQPEMHHHALNRLNLEAGLRRAVENNELVLHYQPVVDLANDRVAGVEVLVRWLDPHTGLIPPTEFIPVAEETGLIRPIGRFILDAACRQAQSWRQTLPSVPLHLCVNASVRQIEDDGFFDDVRNALDDTGFPGEALTLEITESLFMSDFEETITRLCRLKSLGLRLAVDDFGTGYSSLSYLRNLPIDILKIDKAFVDGVTKGVEQSAVARAVVKLARTFGLETVAEGIETSEQLEKLRSIGVDFAQGYFLSRPLDATAMETYLHQFQVGTAGGGACPTLAITTGSR